MLGLGMPELFLIAAILVLMFGGKRIASFGRDVAEGIKGLKEGLKNVD